MIGILGYYGHGSRGDDLLQYALTKLFGETHAFTVSSPNRPTPVPLEKVNEMDALIVGGGTLLGNALPYPLCDTEWIEGVEIPLYIFGAGAKFPHRNGRLEEGRLSSELADAHHALKCKARFFGVRGPLTQEVLAREGIETEVIGDPVLALVPTRAVPNRSPVWLVNLRDPVWFGGRANYLNTARQLVEMLGEVITISPLAFDEADATFMRSLGFLKVEVPSPSALVDIVTHCAGVVAMRLHACVLAAVCGVPFLNLGYKLKSWDWQRTIAPVAPIDFVPNAPSAHAIMSQWHLFGIETFRNIFLDNVRENVRGWRGMLLQRAKEILEDITGEDRTP